MKGLFKYIITVVIFALIGVGASAATYYSRQSGNWNSNTTWSTTSGGAAVGSGVYPIAGDIVNIERGYTVTITANATSASLIISSGSVLNIGAYTFSISGATTNSGTLNFTSSSGAVTFTGDVTLNSGSVWNETAAATFSIAGNFANNATTFTSSTGVHTFSGGTSASNKILSGNTAIVIPNLAITGYYTNNGTVSVSSQLSGASGSNTGYLTQGVNSTLNLGGSIASSNFTLYASNSGNTVNYISNSAQTVKRTSYYNLNFSGSTTFSVSSSSSTLSVAGNLNVSSGSTLNIDSKLSVSGTTTISGAISFAPGTSSSRTYLFSGVVTLNSGSSWTERSSSSFTFNSNIVNNSTTFSPSTGIHNFSGTTTITGSTASNFPNITLKLGAYNLTPNVNMAISGLVINSGATLTIPSTYTFSVSGTSNITGSIIFSGSGSKTFTGDVTLNSGAVWNETAAAAFSFGGTLTNNATTFTASTGVHTFGGSSKLFSGTKAIVIPSAAITGTYTNNGVLSVGTTLSGSGGTLTQGLGGQLNIGGTSTISTLVATNNGNIVNYYGSDQTILSNIYSNLTLSGSGIKTLQSGTTSITGTLLMSGTVSATTVTNTSIDTLNISTSGASLTIPSTYTLGVTGTANITGSIIFSGSGAKTFSNDVTLNAGSVWNETSAATFSIAGNFVNNATTFTASTGVHTFSGSSKSFSGGTNIVIPNLTVSGSYTNSTFINVSTALSVNVLTQTATGNFKIGGSSTFTTFSANAAGNIVEYYGATQSVFSTAYSNLILSGTATKTISSGTSIGATLDLAPVGSTAKLMFGSSGLNITANALSLGGTTRALGTWGSTSATTASNKDNNYFLPSTSYLTITTGAVGAVNTDNSTVVASSTSVIANGTSTATITVTLKDVNSSVVANKVVSISGTGHSTITTSGGTYTGTSNSSGVVVFTVKNNIAEPVVYTVTGDGISIKSKPTINFTPGNLDHFSISTISNQTAGNTVTGVIITALDAANNTVTSFNSTVNFSGTAGISGTSDNFTNGVLSGVSLIPTLAGTSRTFIVTGGSPSSTGTSTFNVAVASVSLGRSTITTNTNTVLPDGISSATISIILKDDYNNLVSGSLVVLNQEANGSSVVSPLSGANTDVNGHVSFTVTDATPETITYTANVKTSNVTIGDLYNTIDIDFAAGAADATNTTFTTSATSLVANGTSTQTFTIVTKDADGNNLVIGGSTVVVSKVSGSGSIGSVTDNNDGTYSVIVTSPALTGSGVFVATLNGNQIKSGTASQTQITLNYIAGSAFQLSFSSQPSTSSVAGVAFATQPKITIQDANGNTITSGADATAVVTLSLSTGTGTLAGTVSMTAVNGVADFTGKGIKINYTGNDKILTASATLNSVSRTSTSNAFAITNSTPTQIIFSTQPSSTTVAGVAFSTQPVITIKDVYGNIATNSSASITLSMSSGSGVLSGTTTINAISGVATFSGLNINLTGNDKVLSASTTGLSSVSINTPISITPAAANKLIYTTQPSSSGIVGAILSQQPIVEIQDIFGNKVSGSSASVTISISTGTGSLTGQTSVNAVGGVVTFTDIAFNTQGVGNILTVASSGLSSANSRSISILAAGAFTINATTVNVTCANLGKITLDITGGVAPFKYDWTDISGTSNVKDRVGISAGTYSVTVTDAHGATANPGLITITGDQSGCTGVAVCRSETASVFSADPDPNNSSYNWSVTPSSGAQISGDGTSSISINWTAVPVGTYQVCVIASSASCGTSSQTCKTVYVKEPEIALFADPTCSGSNLTLHAYGAANYSWSGPNSFSSNVINPIIYNATSSSANGTYTLTATDASGCAATSALTTNVLVSEVPSITSSNITTANSCTTTEGAISIVFSGSLTPTFSWTKNGDPNYSQNSQNISGLTSNNYTVKLTNSDGCSNSTTYFVNSVVASNFTVTTTPTNITCYGNTGSISSTVTPAGTYTYTWTSSSGTFSSSAQNISGLTPGVYSLQLTDAGGCKSTSSSTINPSPAPLNAEATLTNIDCRNSSTGSITLNVSGGTPSYTYSWIGPNSYTSNTKNIAGIRAGTYSVTISDANSCTSIINTYTISEPSGILSATAIVTPINCNGQATGIINLTTTGGTSPYSYSWTKTDDGTYSANTEDLSGLSVGTYNVVITDSKSCTVSSTSYEVSEPARPLAIPSNTISNVNCKGGSDASITIIVTGGTSSYTYNWSNGANTNNLTGLSAGNYTVTVVDLNGCSTQQSYSVSEPALVLSTVITSINEVSCYGQNDGWINTSTTGGTAPYTYSWTKVGTPSFSSVNEDPLSLSAGTYNASVIDANGCSSSSSAIITQPSAINVTASLTNISCYGSSTGAIDVTVTGGTAPYSYSWSNSTNAEDLSSLSAGTYSLTITDANGCSTAQSYTISQPTSLSLTNTSNNLTCNNSADGNISLTVIGGIAPYSYSWTGSNSFTASTKDLTSLTSGTYSVTVTDQNGCTTQLPAAVVLTQPSLITLATPTVTNINCFGQSTGTITLSVSGGSSTYTFLWSDGITTQNRTSLKSGNYNVTITDANGCNINSGVINILQPSAELSLTTSQTNINCYGSANGSIDATILGGTAPYSYQWSKTGDVAFNKTTQDLSLLNIGTYNLTTTDAQNCTVSSSVVITQPTAVSLSMSNANVSCYGASDGSITLAVTGGTAPFTYAWTGPNGFTATTKDISAIAAGVYIVTVTDANGCTSTLTSSAITQPASFTVAASVVGNVNCFNGTDGTVSASSTGGTAPFTYTWSNGSIGDNQNSLAAGLYKVTSVDANGCSAKDSVTISQPSKAIQVFGTVTDTRACDGTPSGKIDVTVDNASGTLTYAWSGPTTIGNIKSPTNLAAGDYTLIVSNTLGCSATYNTTVGTSATLVASVSTVDKTCAVNPDGSAYAVATGGVAPYNYVWASGETTQAIKGLNTGTFTVNVTDANGCVSSASGTVGSPVCDVPIAIPDVFVATNGGTISNTMATNDIDTLFTTAVLSYQLLSVPSTDQGTIKVSLDGTFEFTPMPMYNGIVELKYLITNPMGLSSRTTVNIYVAHIEITDTVVNSDCTKGGSISLSPAGGFPGYTYAWTGPGNFVSSSRNVSALSPGTYQVSITDSVGANMVKSYVITDNCAPGISSIYLSGTNSFTYNASQQAPETFTAHGSTGAVTIVYSGVGSTTYATSSNKPKLPGKYKAVATLAADANNAGATSIDFEFTIDKAPLTVTAADLTVYYGDQITSVLKAGTYSLTGFVGTDDASVISGTVSYTTNYTNTTNVSAAGITITPVVSGLSALNYTFTPVSGKITVKSAANARPLPPTVNNATYLYGSSLIPKKLSSLVVAKPIGSVPAWCNVDSATCDTIPPAMPIIIGKYVYALKSLDTTNGLYSASYTYDTVLIRPNIPTVKDSTYVLGVLTNPTNISLQVTGMTGSIINYFTNAIKQSTAPKLPSSIGIFRYTASQVVNSIESDTAGFNVTMLNVNDLIHLRKIVDTGILQSNSTFNYPFTLVVTNLTKYPFTNVVVTDNLHNSVPLSSEYSVVKNNAIGGLVANRTFDGLNDINVTTSASTLAPFAKDTAKFTMNLVPKGYNGALTNIAYVKADTKWGTIVMQSSSETKANETSKAPTPYLVKDLKIYIPEGFSPNHDGVNDKFVIIKPFNITLDFEVFNRWGNVVYKNSNYNNEWDGRGTGNFAGQDLVDGGYYYSLRAVDDTGKVQIFKGFIIIQR